MVAEGWEEVVSGESTRIVKPAQSASAKQNARARLSGRVAVSSARGELKAVPVDAVKVILEKYNALNWDEKF